jgi:phosphoglucosamine mutase
MCSHMAHRYFGTDGVRGRANSQITADMALKVGQAGGLRFAAASIAIGW